MRKIHLFYFSILLISILFSSCGSNSNERDGSSANPSTQNNEDDEDNEDKKSKVVGTWVVEGSGLSVTKEIRRNGRFSIEGFSTDGISRGTWTGDADNLIFYLKGVQYGTGSVSSDGKTLTVNSNYGVVEYTKQ